MAPKHSWVMWCLSLLQLSHPGVLQSPSTSRAFGITVCGLQQSCPHPRDREGVSKPLLFAQPSQQVPKSPKLEKPSMEGAEEIWRARAGISPLHSKLSLELSQSCQSQLGHNECHLPPEI